MLDSHVRPIIDPPLNYLGRHIASFGISANHVTIAGFACGVIAIFLIINQQYNQGAIFILLNRFFDGLDGAVARQSKLSDFGGFLDIVCDFIIYSGIIFAFGLANPDNLLCSSFLIFSFIGTISSFLAYAIIAAKRQVSSEARGKKSFYYLGGICEGTETALVLVAICVFPDYFNQISVIYGIMCFMTTIGRIYNAWVDFGKN